MPQLCSQSAVKPTHRQTPPFSKPRNARRRGTGAARAPVQASGEGPSLSLLGLPSPALGHTCTTHNEMLFWIGWFARFHSDGLYVPHELKTLDRPVLSVDGSPVLGQDGQPQTMRCVREVA